MPHTRIDQPLMGTVLGAVLAKSRTLPPDQARRWNHAVAQYTRLQRLACFDHRYKARKRELADILTAFAYNPPTEEKTP